MSATSMSTATRDGSPGSMNSRMPVTPSGVKNFSRLSDASQCCWSSTSLVRDDGRHGADPPAPSAPAATRAASRNQSSGANYPHVRAMTRSQRTRMRRRSRSKARSKFLLGLMVVLAVVGVAGLSAVGYVVSIASSAPPLDSLKPRDPGRSVVLAADGKRLGVIQSGDLRTTDPGDQIPKTLKDATVAIEDERFYEHKGVDYEGIVRAAMKNLEAGETVQGGSTITMQLVRNLYITHERTFERKIREAKLAEELEKEHSKEWILDEYLNTVPYGTLGGQTAVGVWAAARIYFNKSAKNLTLDESALLAGLPQAPTPYSPVRAPEEAEARRNQVLAQMAELKA